jgi:hypothetical protein
MVEVTVMVLVSEGDDIIVLEGVAVMVPVLLLVAVMLKLGLTVAVGVIVSVGPRGVTVSVAEPVGLADGVADEVGV